MSTKDEKSTLFDSFESSLTKTSVLAYFLVGILTTLFFIEAFRAFVPGIYAALFHVVFQDPGWVGSLMTILALLLIFVPLFTNKLCKHFGQNKIYLLSIIVIAIARVLIACHLASLIETILAGLIIAFYGIFASIFLKRLVQNDLGMPLKAKVSIFTIVLIASFLLDMLIRSIGFSSDITLLPFHLNPDLWSTLQYLWLIVQIPLSLILIGVTLKTAPTIFPEPSTERPTELRNTPWILNALGLGMLLFLLFNVFLYTNSIAEYTGTSYLILNPILIGAVILVLLYLLFAPRTFIYQLRINICFNIILVLALAAFLFLGTTWSYPTAILTTLAVGIMFLNAHLLVTNASIMRKEGNQLKVLSKVFSYSFLFYVIMTVFHVFTTDYAFTIPAFAGLGPLFLFIGGLVLALTTILAHLQLNKFSGGDASK
ncbi:MAG: hypothetical protein ACTSQI_00875 [Candidatus Helarchaeota archaeon]